MNYNEKARGMITEDMGVQFCYVTNSFDCPTGGNCAECELSKDYEKEMEDFTMAIHHCLGGVLQCDEAEVFEDENGELGMVGKDHNIPYLCEIDWCEEVKGCKYCRNETPFEQEAYEDGDYYWYGGDETYESFISYRDRYINETDFEYCPYCGRKLEVEK